jgi:predicted O-linked N-acetylglucosamine transferase (SPINDLY family)
MTVAAQPSLPPPSRDAVVQAWLGAMAQGRLPDDLTMSQRSALPDVLAGLSLEAFMTGLERARPHLHPAMLRALYEYWLAANPHSPQTGIGWYNLGAELSAIGDKAAAAAAFGNALTLMPHLYQAAVNLGLMHEAQGQTQQALDAWQRHLQSDEARTALLNQQGRLLEETGRLPEAERTLYRSLLTNPHQPDVLQHWGHIRQRLCAWPAFGPPLPGLDPGAVMGQAGALSALALFDKIADQRAATARWLERKTRPTPAYLAPKGGYRHDKIRIGYLSSDFRRHAMAYLITELLERHNRDRFVVYGYCSSDDDGSAERARILAAFDQPCMARGYSDEALARRIRADEIDILIDLNGLTQGGRMQTLRWKPAPMQVSYLGFIGPIPLPELDFILCDDYVIPPAAADAYGPRPLYLPGHYQANDTRLAQLPPMSVSRAGEGLPDDAFIFCNAAHHYKLTPAMFALWMRILAQTPGSVLWLASENPWAVDNLRPLVAAHGLDPARLILTPRVQPEHYRARLALADLFLDTAPYNAGTIASDALRAGLPLLTLSGESFASRMAGSLLRAVGLPDLIATTPEDYVAKATSLAGNRDALARMRASLHAGAWMHALGDMQGFTRAYEGVLGEALSNLTA